MRAPGRRVMATAAALTAAVCLAACGGSSGGTTTASGSGGGGGSTLKLEDYLSSQEPWTGWAQDLTSKVATDTGDKVQIKVYPDGQLVSQKGALQAIRSRSVDMGVVPDIGGGELAEGFSVADGPFFTSTWQQSQAITTSQKVRDYQNTLLKPFKLHLLASCTEGFNYLLTQQPVHSKADLKGMKIRVPDQQSADEVAAVGATPVTIAIGDTYEALQLHTVVGAYSALTNFYSQHWYEAAKNVDLIPLSMSYVDLVINLDSWNSLSADMQQKVSADAAAAIPACSTAEQNETKKIESEIESGGAHLVQPGDIQPYVQATAALRTKQTTASKAAKDLTGLENSAAGTSN
jgi:TRAP-type C4-dicarboxylate transport system substrate-binding protein